MESNSGLCEIQASTVVTTCGAYPVIILVAVRESLINPHSIKMYWGRCGSVDLRIINIDIRWT
jgi:hypothetical protein